MRDFRFFQNCDIFCFDLYWKVPQFWKKRESRICLLQMIMSHIFMIYPFRPGQKYKNIFVWFLVIMKTSKFAFEIKWPLVKMLWLRVRDHYLSHHQHVGPTYFPSASYTLNLRTFTIHLNSLFFLSESSFHTCQLTPLYFCFILISLQKIK